MKSLQASLSTLLLAVVASTALAQQDDILRPEEAYRYAVADTGDAIEIDWVIEDGYYLYRNKMSYQSGSDAIVWRHNRSARPKLPLAMASSEATTKLPMWPERLRWVPPQNSTE